MHADVGFSLLLGTTLSVTAPVLGSLCCFLISRRFFRAPPKGDNDNTTRGKRGNSNDDEDDNGVDDDGVDNDGIDDDGVDDDNVDDNDVVDDDVDSSKKQKYLLLLALDSLFENSSDSIDVFLSK